LVDVIDANGQDTINPLVKRLRNFYATDLEACQAALQFQGYNVPNHLSIAAVTIVSYVGPHQANLPNGECFQFSTYFLDHLFVSGDAAHNANLVPVPFYMDAFNAIEPIIFGFFGKNFPRITLPCVGFPGSYGDPTGPSVSCEGAIGNGDRFAFPHAPVRGVGNFGAVGLTPLNATVVNWYNTTWPYLNLVAGTPHQFIQGVTIGDIWFSGWWYSSGQVAASCRHSERALGVFLESIYANANLAGLPAPGAGALPRAPALPAAYVNMTGQVPHGAIPFTLVGANHPDIQPDAVEIYNAIQNTNNVVAVIVHIKNMLRMCSQCAARLRDFTQQYPVANGPIVGLGDGNAGQIRFVFVVGSGQGGAIEIYQ
jgi:hypothetical protein